MIQDTNQGLEDILRHNDTTRRTQETEKDLQLQEEPWRENELIRKAQEEPEERKKKSELDAYTNKEQQIPEKQQAKKSAMEHSKK